MGEPVALQCSRFFYLYSQNGVEMYNGEITGWNSPFEGKIWALADSNPESTFPCGLVSRNTHTLSKRRLRQKIGGGNGERGVVRGFS
jgi:hypothetical protein